MSSPHRLTILGFNAISSRKPRLMASIRLDRFFRDVCGRNIQVERNIVVLSINVSKDTVGLWDWFLIGLIRSSIYFRFRLVSHLLHLFFGKDPMALQIEFGLIDRVTLDHFVQFFRTPILLLVVGGGV